MPRKSRSLASRPKLSLGVRVPRKATSLTLPTEMFARLEGEKLKVEQELRRSVPMSAVFELLLSRALEKPGACIRKEARAAASAPPLSHVQARAAAEARVQRQGAKDLQERVQAVSERFQAVRKEKRITLPDFMREVSRLGLSMKSAEIHRFFSGGSLDVSPDTPKTLDALEAWLSECGGTPNE